MRRSRCGDVLTRKGLALARIKEEAGIGENKFSSDLANMQDDLASKMLNCKSRPVNTS